jgi:hypothetical protein
MSYDDFLAKEHDRYYNEKNHCAIHDIDYEDECPLCFDDEHDEWLIHREYYYNHLDVAECASRNISKINKNFYFFNYQYPTILRTWLSDTGYYHHIGYNSLYIASRLYTGECSDKLKYQARCI